MMFKMNWLRMLYIFVVLTIYCNAVPNNVSIVIVGAGAAGIAAATKLLENSFTNIRILEAQNRIGGRIHSVEFGGSFVDVGAEYCHGEKGNVVFEMAEKLDILESSNFNTTEFIKLHSSDGNPIAPDLASDFIDACYSSQYALKESASMNLRDAFLEVYNTTVLEKYANNEANLKIARDAIRSIEAVVLGYEGAFSWDVVSSASHFEDCEGDQDLTWKIRGYRIILDILMKNFPDPSKKLSIEDKLFLNKKVDKIIWNGDAVKVHTTDNSSLIATHVIFTPSVAVLKEQKNVLFEPQLPSFKQDALEAIGFDAVMKIILHFPETWWGQKDHVFGFFWSKEDLLKSAKEFPHGPQKNGISWVASISSFVKPKIDSNVLIGWVTFDLIPEIETTSEEIILKGCNYLIKKFFGKHYNVTNADKVLRSQWKTNPNIRESYSFLKFGHYKDDVSYNAKLAEPLTNDEGKLRLQFAGEATNPLHFATVHGAIETGRREADRIINLYK